jgi:hypothetical protein
MRYFPRFVDCPEGFPGGRNGVAIQKPVYYTIERGKKPVMFSIYE